MQVFLETGRLVLRRFTQADVDNLFDLGSDPAVIRFLTGGKPTPRDVIQNETLPRFLHDYDRFEGYGFWAAIERSTGRFLGWFHFSPPEQPFGPGRARIPPSYVCLGQGLRHRRIDRADQKGLHRARRAAGGRVHHGDEHRVSAGDGEGRHEVDANVPGIVAGPHRWLGARGSGIRARQSGLGTSGSRSRNVKRRPSRCLTRQA